MFDLVDTSTSRAASDQRGVSANQRCTARRCSPEGDLEATNHRLDGGATPQFALHGGRWRVRREVAGRCRSGMPTATKTAEL